MESSKWLKIAIACLIGGVLTLLLGYAISTDNTDISKYIAKTYKKADSSGFASDQAVYSCSGEPKKVAPTPSTCATPRTWCRCSQRIINA